VHPIIFETPYFSLKAYGLFVAMGFIAGLAFALREARQQGLEAQPILDLAFYIILSAIIGSRLFYVLTTWESYRHNLLDILKVWQGGLTFFGGFILSFAAGVVYMKRHQMAVWKTFDLFAPALALGDFFGRIGCFFAGCCYGRECSYPWAVTFIDPQSLARIGVPLHPTQLYASLASLATFLLLWFWSSRKAYDGQLSLLWIFCYSFFRLIIEYFRGDPRGYLILGTFAVSQVIAAILLMVSLSILVLLKNKNNSC
jgi:phosphatidylglycerol---prolipoprotein diacylglyceryl transferase